MVEEGEKNSTALPVLRGSFLSHLSLRLTPSLRLPHLSLSLSPSISLSRSFLRPGLHTDIHTNIKHAQIPFMSKAESNTHYPLPHRRNLRIYHASFQASVEEDGIVKS